MGQFTQKTGIPVLALAPISEVMDYLVLEKVPVLIEGRFQPVPQALKQIFDDYLAEYGTLS